MAFTREDVQRLADLSRLALREDELTHAEQELGRILDYVGRLSSIDTSGIPETEPGQETTSWRTDTAIPCDDLGRQLILMDFPDRLGDLLRVPAVFENPKG